MEQTNEIAVDEVKAEQQLPTPPRKRYNWRKNDFIKNGGRYMLLLPSLVFMVIFAYLPMVGIVIAFQNYDPIAGFFKSSFVGLENFRFFFESSDWLQVTLNTLYLNTLFILSGTLMSVGIAIVMSELNNKPFTRISQTLMTLQQ